MTFPGKLLEGCDEQDGESLNEDSTDSAPGGFASVATTTFMAVSVLYACIRS